MVKKRSNQSIFFPPYAHFVFFFFYPVNQRDQSIVLASPQDIFTKRKLQDGLRLLPRVEKALK